MTATIRGTRINRTYTVELDGRDYRVEHNTWTGTRWQSEGERWTVHSRVGIHSGAHVCDPEKPTYKRVVAAVKSALNGGAP